MRGLATQFICLHVLPDLLGGDGEGVHVDVVATSVVEDDIACGDLRTIDRLVAHGLGDKAVVFADHCVPGVGVEVPGAESVSDLAKPGLTSDELWVDMVVRNDVHIAPPSVEEVVVPLMVHAHLQEVHCRQVARRSRADHLTVVNDSVVGAAHGVKVLIVIVGHPDDLAVPAVLLHVLLDILFTSAARMRANDSHKVV